MQKIAIYDTTLRDGSQMEGVSFSVEDKIRIARRLDAFGMDYIEGGWPGAAPKDTEFFARMRDIPLLKSKLVAFGSTRRANIRCEDDPLLAQLLAAETPVVTIVGKTSAWHVTETLRIPLAEAVTMIGDTVRYLKMQDKEVIFDAEHFFDGYKQDRHFTVDALRAANDAGVDILCLCDTNGGTLPHEIAEIVADIAATFPNTIIGMHPHDDSNCGTANALAAVRAGSTHVQGTINGYGERTGNANLIPIVAALRLKMGYDCLSDNALAELTNLSNFLDETANMTPNARAAYIGRNAFTHKAGLHADAIAKAPTAYDHIRPELVGNTRRLLVSELSGGATIAAKAQALGYDLDKRSPATRAVLQQVMDREHDGYSYEGAEASFELLLKRATGDYRKLFDIVAYRALIERRAGDAAPITEATLRLRVGDEELLTVAEGDGPVNALDGALRNAIARFYPELSGIRLTDYKVRVVTSGEGTAARVRAIVESTGVDGKTWNTVGVSTNIIEASWLALVDAVEYGILVKKSE